MKGKEIRRAASLLMALMLFCTFMLPPADAASYSMADGYNGSEDVRKPAGGDKNSGTDDDDDDDEDDDDDDDDEDDDDNDEQAQEMQSVSDFSVRITESSSVKWYYDAEDCAYYLLLPACADLNALTVSFSAQESVFLDGKEIESGDTLSLEENYRHTLASGEESAALYVMRSQNIPAMFVYTESGSMSNINANKYYREAGTMLLLNSDGTAQYDGGLESIGGRGNSSWGYSPKRPYNIKMTDKAALCDMGKSRKWALISTYLEQSMMRNSVSYDLGRALGLKYSIKYHYIDFYANGEYYGTYILTERVEVDDVRVDITDLEKATEKANGVDDLSVYGKAGVQSGEVKGTYKYYEIPADPADITGGYLLEHQQANRYFKDPCGFVSDLGQPVLLKNPEYASRAQIEYISGFYQEMEDAVYSDTGYNALGKHWSEYIDMDSLVTVYLIHELASSPDSSGTSFFLYKESDFKGDGKFHFGPLWDFDLAYANYKTSIYDPNKFYTNRFVGKDTGVLGIMGQVYKDEQFLSAVAEKYCRELLPAIMTVCGNDMHYAGLESMRSKAAQYARSYEMNYIVWDITKRPLSTFNGSNLIQNICYLEEYMTTRMLFLFREWLPVYLETENSKGIESSVKAAGGYLLGVQEEDWAAWDINGDGIVNVFDFQLIKRGLI